MSGPWKDLPMPDLPPDGRWRLVSWEGGPGRPTVVKVTELEPMTDTATDLASRIAARLAVETPVSHKTAWEHGIRWAGIARRRGWSDADAERIALECAAAGIGPDMASVLMPAAVADVRGALRRLADELLRPVLWLVDRVGRWGRR